MSTVNEKMTSIANAIRSVTGITSKLSMTEIEKEVKDLAGGVSKNYSTGSFTLTSSTSSGKVIRHGLGRVPKILIFFKLAAKESSATALTTSVTDRLFYALFDNKGISNYFTSSYNSSASSGSRVSNNAYHSLKSNPLENTSTSYFTNITATHFTTPSYLTEDDEYVWIAIKGE